MKLNLLLYILIFLPLLNAESPPGEVTPREKEQIERSMAGLEAGVKALKEWKEHYENEEDKMKNLELFRKFGNLMNFGKLLTSFSAIGAVLSLALSFVPIDSAVFKSVTRIESKVDMLSSQLEDVKNALINEIDKAVYSAAYMTNELNIKNTWDHWIHSTSTYLDPDTLKKNEKEAVRSLTLFTEKYEANQVMDSMRNLHRSVVTEQDGSLANNLLQILMKSSKCDVITLLQMKALYNELFTQGGIVTLNYLLFKRFSHTFIDQQLTELQDMHLDIERQFAIKEMECYNRGEETAKEVIKEELDISADHSLPLVVYTLQEKLNMKVPWIPWYLIAYDKNDDWGSVEKEDGKHKYYASNGSFVKVDGGNKQVAALFTPLNMSDAYSEDLNICGFIENIPPPLPEPNSFHPPDCFASSWASRIPPSDRLIAYHIIYAYYNKKDVDNYHYERSDHDIRDTKYENHMIASERNCEINYPHRKKRPRICDHDMNIVASFDLRKNRTDPCARNPCGHHGECYVRWKYATAALCICHRGYHGETCEEDISTKVDLSQLPQPKIGAVDLVSVFHGLRDGMEDIYKRLSSKLTDLELLEIAGQRNMTQEIRDARRQLTGEIEELKKDVQNLSATVEQGFRDIRKFIEAELNIVCNKLFYARELKQIYLVSDYYTEYLNNKLSKQKFIEKMKKEDDNLSFDSIRRRYADFIEGRSISGTRGIINDFKFKFWNESSTQFRTYKENVSKVKNYTINEYTWFVKAWKEYEVVSFQKKVRDFQHWDTVKRIIDEDGFDSDRLTEIPDYDNVRRFQESEELKEAHTLRFELKWNFIDQSCGNIILHDGIEELTLQSGDSYEDQNVVAFCHPFSGQEIVDPPKSQCKKNSNGTLQWTKDRLECEKIGSCCNEVQISSATLDLQNFTGSYKKLEKQYQGYSIYQKQDDLKQLEDAFIFWGTEMWYIDREVSVGSATIFNLIDSKCPGHVKLDGGWSWSNGTSWIVDKSFQIRCI